MIKVISQSTSERKREMEDKYEKYLDLYYNSSLTVKEIFKKIDVGRHSEVYAFIMKHTKSIDVSPHKRAKLIQFGKWLQ